MDAWEADTPISLGSNRNNNTVKKLITVSVEAQPFGLARKRAGGGPPLVDVEISETILYRVVQVRYDAVATGGRNTPARRNIHGWH